MEAAGRTPTRSRLGATVAISACVVAAALVVTTAIAMRASERRAEEAVARAPARSPATSHLPEGCDLAARVDLVALMSDPSTVRQLANLFDGEGARWAGIDATGAERALRRAGIDPAADLHDAAVCVLAPSAIASAAMLVVVAGNLPPDALVRAVADLGGAPGAPIAGRPVVRRKDGGGEIFVGQAVDGAIVLATTEALFEAAVRATDPSRAAPVPAGGPVSIAISRVAVAEMGRGAGEIGELAARELSLAERVTAIVDPAARRAEVRFETAGAAAAIQVEGAIDELVLPMIALEVPALASVGPVSRRIEGGALVLGVGVYAPSTL